MNSFVYALLATLALVNTVRGQGLVLSATPSNVVNGTTKTLEIKCQAPALDEVSNLPVLIRLEMVDGEDVIPVASDRGSGPKLHMTDDPSMSVEGSLKDGGNLHLTIKEPSVNHTGVYMCRFANLNMNGEFNFKVMSETVNVTFTEPDEPTPAPVVVPDSCSCDQVWAEVKDLRETVIAENRQLKEQLKSYDDSCRVSFTARIEERAGKKFWSNNPMIFDSVLTNKGEAYNVETGIFTAPCTGQYFFRLTMRTHQERDSGYVDGAIEVNGEQMARTSVFSDSLMDHYEQASNGLVVSLKEGDEVVVMIHSNSNGKVYGEFFSIFSGFFLSA